MQMAVPGLAVEAAPVSMVLGTRRGGGGPGARKATPLVVPTARGVVTANIVCYVESILRFGPFRKIEFTKVKSTLRPMWSFYVSLRFDILLGLFLLDSILRS